jgi:rubrerythrin
MVNLPNGFPSDLLGAFNVLKTHATLSVEDLEVLALLEAAGEEFYVRIARGVRDAEARALLLQNGREERGHAYRLVKAIALESGKTFELPEHAHNPFVAAMPSEMPATAEFLKMLESGEQDSDRQYQAWANGASKPEVAKSLRQNGREESRHGERDAQAMRLIAANG